VRVAGAGPDGRRITRASRTKDLVAALRDLAARRLNSREIDERRGIPPGIVLELGELGLLGLQVPEAYGGPDFAWTDVIALMQELGAIDLTLASFVLTNNFPGIRPISRFGSPSLRARVLPALAQGRILAGYAQTEPQAGSDVQAITSRAVPAGPRRWRLTGRKVWVGNAGWAGILTVIVRGGDELGSGLTAFAVDTRRAGVAIGAEHATMGLRGMVQNRVTLQDVEADGDDLVGEWGGGLAVAHDSMGATRVGIAAMCLGALRRCAQLLLRFAERRTIATGQLVEHPAALLSLAKMAARCEALDALLATIAERLDAGGEAPAEVLAIAKVAASEFVCAAADDLVQSLGGRGFDECNVAARIARDARVTRIFEGTSDVLLSFVGGRAWLEEPSLFSYLRDSLDAPAIADRLTNTITRLRAGRYPAGAALEDLAAATPWRLLAAGRVTLWTVMTAALERAVRHGVAQPQSASWAREHLEEAERAAIDGSADDCLIDRRAAVTAWIRSCTGVIGEFEQSLPGLGLDLDPLLSVRDQGETS
jgi:alkylation response protein AidB-like acyl-CoA dehydrogenase